MANNMKPDISGENASTANAEFSTAQQQAKFKAELSPNSKFRRSSVIGKAAAALGIGAEKTGRFVGRKFFRKFFEDKKERVETFDVAVSGIENLKDLKDKPFILAANHLRHEGPFGDVIFPPDSFVLEKLVNEVTSKPIQTVVMQDSDMPFLQNRVVVGFETGIIKEQEGLIPVKRRKVQMDEKGEERKTKKPGAVNLEFVRKVGESVAKGDPILIFPEGNWFSDWDPNRPLEEGVALIAQKYKLPVVPAYIRGARNWKPNNKVDVAFGAPIDVNSKGRDEVMGEIRSGITNLQQTARSHRAS